MEHNYWVSTPFKDFHTFLPHLDIIAPNIKMLPDVILDIIQSYVDSMNFYSDLPSLHAVRKLMDRCDNWVMLQLGTVLGMPSTEMMRLRFRLQMRGDFVFYFHMSAPQRHFMLITLERGVEGQRHLSNMTWIFLEKEPKLINIPRYKSIFKNGLFCRMMEYLITEPPTHHLI